MSKLTDGDQLNLMQLLVEQLDWCIAGNGINRLSDTPKTGYGFALYIKPTNDVQKLELYLCNDIICTIAACSISSVLESLYQKTLKNNF